MHTESITQAAKKVFVSPEIHLRYEHLLLFVSSEVSNGRFLIGMPGGVRSTRWRSSTENAPLATSRDVLTIVTGSLPMEPVKSAWAGTALVVERGWTANVPNAGRARKAKTKMQ